MDWSGRWRYLPAAGFALLILVTSLVPSPAGGEEQVIRLLGVALDKWVHLLAYLALATLLAWGRVARVRRALVGVFLLTVAFGGTVELLQTLVPLRQFDLIDAAANTLGAGMGVIGWWRRHR